LLIWTELNRYISSHEMHHYLICENLLHINILHCSKTQLVSYMYHLRQHTSKIQLTVNTKRPSYVKKISRKLHMIKSNVEVVVSFSTRLPAQE
jgi:hypothetical protein